MALTVSVGARATAVVSAVRASVKAGGGGGINNPIVSPVLALVAMTLTVAQNGNVFTSLGATGDRSTRALALPVEGLSPSGLEFWFNTYATEGMRVQAAAGQSIMLGDQVSASGGYIETVERNQWLCIYKLTSGIWAAKFDTFGWQVSE